MVLTAGLLSSLRENFVDATLVLVCRAAFVSVCGLFPTQPDRVIDVDFSPYEWAVPSGELFAALEPVLRQTEGVRADLFIAGEYQPTWFTWTLAAQLKPQRAIQATHAKRPGSVLEGVLDHYGLDRIEFEGPKLTPNLHEIQRYAEIIKFLGGVPTAGGTWILPGAIDPQVQDTLRGFGLRSGEYLVCVPLGAEGVPVKRWPRESYLQALGTLRQKSPLPVLFAGHESERADLDEFAQALGGDRVYVHAGTAAEIPILAGLILHSRAYLGNDTGPMHLAAAYGVSGVTIYGGGHWPAYGPWGHGPVALVHPLPCFGCNWDCLFGHGVCVESIPVASVVEALDQVFAGKEEEARTVVLDELPLQVLDLIRDANRRYREAELDRGDRLSSIIELRRNVDNSHGRLEKLEQTAADRLRALEAQHAAIEQLRHESERRREGMDELTALLDLRDARIEELERISNERLAALESQAASYEKLKKEADIRSAGLLELTEHIAARDRRIHELEEIAVERYKALQTQSRAFEELRTEAERRTAGLIELTAHIAAQEETIRKYVQIAEDRRVALDAQAAAYRELHHEAERRTAGLIELTAHIAAQDETIRKYTQIAEDRRVALDA
jgi:ADP-heptose:LPS heptosyltransferase